MPKRQYSPNKSQLARDISVGPMALKRLFERSDYPKWVNGKGWNIAQWQRYADENVSFHSNHSGNGSKARGDMINAREQALIRRNQLAADREQLSLDRERGRYWEKLEGKESFNKYSGMMWREIEKAMIHELPPRQEGLRAYEIAQQNKERLRRIRENAGKIMVAE